MLDLLVSLGWQARWALPAGVFVGIAWPWLAMQLRPVLTAAVIGTLATALVRIDWDRFGLVARRPALVGTLVAWQLLLSPVLVWLAAEALRLPEAMQLALVLQGAAPPIGSAAAFAMFVGVEGTLCVVGSILATLLLPFTLTPLVALLLPASGVSVEIVAFFLRVSVVVGAPFLVAWILRRTVGPARLARNDQVLAGLNVLLLVVFAIAVMDGVTAALFADPLRIGGLLLLAWVATLLLHLAGYWLLRRTGVDEAISATLLSGNRNMGLMLAATAGTAGETFALYAGLAQIPMYFAPLLLGPMVRRLRRGGRA
ncbi:MAG: hypothetical protein AB7P21_01585 [Lautropia sp.]